MSTVVCPDCQGAKAGFGIACSDRGCRPIERACDFCGGEGRVSPEANERWQKGRAARDARVKQRLSLFEKAAVLGIAPEVLNGMRTRTAHVWGSGSIRAKMYGSGFHAMFSRQV